MCAEVDDERANANSHPLKISLKMIEMILISPYCNWVVCRHFRPVARVAIGRFVEGDGVREQLSPIIGGECVIWVGRYGS